MTSYYDGSNFGLESSIFQWNGEMFVVFQKIPTKGAVRFTFFEISGNNYLAVANRYDGSTFSTKSFIYRWNGSHFNKFQEIATAGALGCVVFVIDNNTLLPLQVITPSLASIPFNRLCLSGQKDTLSNYSLFRRMEPMM